MLKMNIDWLQNGVSFILGVGTTLLGNWVYHKFIQRPEPSEVNVTLGPLPEKKADTTSSSKSIPFYIGTKNVRTVNVNIIKTGKAFTRKERRKNAIK
jgi:hypothetical protein